MRLWVLLNMETPEKKPASSTAKRARVTDSAATSLQKEGSWLRPSGLFLTPLHSHYCLILTTLPQVLTACPAFHTPQG